MNIKDIKRLLGIEDGVKTTLSANAPELLIQNKMLEITIGQWLGVIPDSVKSGNNGFQVISSISASELIKKYRVSKQQLDETNIRFANLLEMIGIGKGNTCLLNNFDEDELTFDCNFTDTGEVAQMKIRFGEWLDTMPGLVMDFDGIKTDYDFFHRTDDRDECLKMSSYVTDIDGFKKFSHFASDYTYYASVYDRDDRIDVEINYPGCLEGNGNPFIDTKIMEEALSSIALPCTMEYLCSQIEKGLKLRPSAYNMTLTMKQLSSSKGKNEEKITDKLVYSTGAIMEFTTIRNGRKVSIDYYGNWSIDSFYYKLAQNRSNTISYSIIEHGTTEDQLDEATTAREIYAEAKKDMEETKKLAKKFFPKKEK